MFRQKFRNLQTAKSEKEKESGYDDVWGKLDFQVNCGHSRCLTVGQDHSRETLSGLLTPQGRCDYVGIFRSCNGSRDAPVDTLK